MTKKKAKPATAPKLRPDANEIAFRVLQEATGEKPKTIPGQGPKNPEAVKRGRVGGGRRASNLDQEQRERIAKEAARRRWDRE